MPVQNPIPADAPPEATAADLARWFGVNLRTIYRWARLGIIPQPVQFSRAIQRYSTADVREVIDRKIAAAGNGVRKRGHRA